ncbi:MAG: triacylglycerol lipase [Myxococcota bacterium]|jgi:pimeloyl-ACP methyl ester carboxylesterase
MSDLNDGFDWGRLWRWTRDVPERRDDVVAVVQGAVGNRIPVGAVEAAPMLDIRLGGKALDLSDPLQIPGAMPHVVVMIHGLMATERFWGQVGIPGFDARLATDLDATVVCVRYNSGRHISINGEELASALDALVAHWPVPVEQVTLVGHSMGGLVARSAIHYSAELPWMNLCRRLVLLGVPQRGAPLEQVAHIAAFTLRAIPNPWTWGISWLLRQRSEGIRDLRHGYLVHEEWQERHDESLTIGRRHLVPFASHIDHYCAAGSMGPSEHHVVSKLMGDGMVTPFSAKDEGVTGTPTDRICAETRVFPGISHVGIAGDDGVYAQVLIWCQREKSAV